MAEERYWRDVEAQNYAEQSSRIAELERELAEATATERARCLAVAKTLCPEIYRLHAMIERGCPVTCPTFDQNRICHCDDYDLQSVHAERKRNREMQELTDVRGGMSKQYWREIDDA